MNFFCISITFLSFVIFSNYVCAESDVLLLAKNNFSSVVNSEKLILVEFFAPWCGHCKNLEPEYEKAATELKSTGIKLAKVDCTVEQELCSEHDVEGFPTLKVFHEGKEPIDDYAGSRRSAGIVSYMKKQVLPVLSELSAVDIDTFKESDRVVIVAFLSSQDGEAKEIVEQLAKEWRSRYVFGICTDPEGAEKYEVNFPSVVLFKQFDEGINKFNGAFDKERLREFIRSNAQPIIDEIGPDNYASYQTGKLLAYIFVDSDSMRVRLTKTLEPVAREFREQINMVWIDATRYGVAAETLNLKPQWPAFGIQNTSDATKYPFNQSKQITADAVHDFVSRVVKGEIAPAIKSEPIPEVNDAPVTKVVADEFDKIVFDEQKDVLLEIYAPWCGHCKRLAPTWEELGKTVRSRNPSGNIIIAKMDGTVNDMPLSVPFKITGFPSIKLFKAGTDREIIDYTGDRSLENFLEFIAKNAFNKLENVSEVEEPEPVPEDMVGKDKAGGISHDEL
ncbi:uncharacterized protein VTP21DRAFT_9433 [Calcarisporiella thermophila]|uniref:uncharacterized protein n=1 Tax=Calcarisporiella thermophila TaxID=911321 RepID=UPI003743E8A9